MFFNTICFSFHQTAFYTAVEQKNINIIKLLLTNNRVDINLPYVLLYPYLSNSKINYINSIQKIFNEIKY